MRKESKRSRELPHAYGGTSVEYGPALRNGAPSGPRAGRRAKNRRRRRKRALVCFYIFLFLTVVLAAAAVSLTVLFRIESIEVRGTSRYSQAQILSACGIRKGENLFLVRTGDAEKRISGKLPYIGSVSVRRSFPAGITVTVAEAPVCGVVPDGKGYAVLGTDFRVLELTDKPPAGRPRIKGIALKNAKAGGAAEFSEPALKNSLAAVVSALSKNGLKPITGMDFSNTDGVLVEYDGRVTMNFGLCSDLDYKVRYAKALFDSGQIKKTERGTLNLSTTAENDTAYFDPAASSG